MFCQKFMPSGLSEAFQSTHVYLIWLHNILKLIFWFVTNLKLDKIKASVVMKYLQKKGITPRNYMK